MGGAAGARTWRDEPRSGEGKGWRQKPTLLVRPHSPTCRVARVEEEADLDPSARAGKAMLSDVPPHPTAAQAGAQLFGAAVLLEAPEGRSAALPAARRVVTGTSPSPVFQGSLGAPRTMEVRAGLSRCLVPRGRLALGGALTHRVKV